jgi:3-hydroxyisobutyrate dehydrogenase
MSEDAQLPTVALLGTGIMGTGMARNIARAGLPLRVWNRTPAKAEALRADGAVPVPTAAEAVRDADVIITMLGDGASVTAAMSQAAAGLRPGQIWAQTSTVGPQALASLTALAAGHGLVFIDSPVQGTRQPAEAGQLLVYAAGPEVPERDAIRDRVQPVYDAIGAKTVWFPSVGEASRLKLVANSWVLALTVSLGETIAFAERLGVDPRQFLSAIAGGPTDCAYIQGKAATMLAENYTPNFPLDMAAKDARLIVEAGEDAGARMDVTRAGLARLNRAAEHGHAHDDISAAYFASFD